MKANVTLKGCVNLRANFGPKLQKNNFKERCHCQSGLQNSEIVRCANFNTQEYEKN